MPWVTTATLEAATDVSTAALVRTPAATETKRVLDTRYVRGSELSTEVSGYLSENSAVVTAASSAASVAAQQAVLDLGISYAQFDTNDDMVVVVNFRDPVLNNIVAETVTEKI